MNKLFKFEFLPFPPLSPLGWLFGARDFGDVSDLNEATMNGVEGASGELIKNCIDF
ncbi:MAG TPA: hypothetical protein VG738_10480 [Chitinophagaceae bacterium]|nr:hypothetical protein [Chitinophagaceae bacterium]